MADYDRGRSGGYHNRKRRYRGSWEILALGAGDELTTWFHSCRAEGTRDGHMD